MRGVAARGRHAAAKAGFGDKAVVEDARKAVRKARRAPVGTAAEQSTKEELLRAALAAVERADGARPADVAVAALASELGEAAADALVAQQQEVSAHGFQKDPRYKGLQTVYDSAGEIGSRRRTARSQQDARDTYYADGAKSAAGGGFTRLGSTAPYTAAGPAPSTKHLDLQRGQPDPDRVYRGRSYKGAVAYWLGKGGGDAADQAHKALAALKDMDGDLYQAVVAEVSVKVARKHGLEDAERAAIATYSSGDYGYMNPATSGDRGWLKGAGARRDPDLHSDDVSKLTPEQVAAREAAREERVTAYQFTRQTDDAAFDKRYREKTGKLFQPGPAEKGRPTGEALYLEQTRESDLNVLASEGALHSALAVRGMAKLPPFEGRVYRKDLVDNRRFLQDFRTIDPDPLARGEGVVEHKAGSHTFPHIVSTSKARTVSAPWIVGKETGDHDVLYEIDVVDGRDVTQLSRNSAEVEVLLLPGTKIAVDAIEVERCDTPGMLRTPQDPTPAYTLVVKAHQVGRAPLPR